jgi:hypothetical protein
MVRDLIGIQVPESPRFQGTLLTIYHFLLARISRMTRFFVACGKDKDLARFGFICFGTDCTDCTVFWLPAARIRMWLVNFEFGAAEKLLPAPGINC